METLTAIFHTKSSTIARSVAMPFYAKIYLLFTGGYESYCDDINGQPGLDFFVNPDGSVSTCDDISFLCGDDPLGMKFS